MDESLTRAEIEAFGRLLDAYGAERTRWPAAERLRFAPLLASNAEASSLLARAAAFDRLLDMAPRPDPERERATVERIVAAAARSPRARAPRPSASKAGWRQGAPWPAVALLAASLLVGIFAGISLAERFGDEEAEFSQAAILDEGAGALTVEELL